MVGANEFRSTMRALSWERAKGALRELVAVKGSVHSGDDKSSSWEELERRIEKFIKTIEDEGLQE